MELHRHPHEEIFVIAEGTGTFVVDGTTLQAGSGDVVLAPAGTAHRFVYAGSDRLRLTAIHHAPKFTDGMARTPTGRPAVLVIGGP